MMKKIIILLGLAMMLLALGQSASAQAPAQTKQTSPPSPVPPSALSSPSASSAAPFSATSTIFEKKEGEKESYSSIGEFIGKKFIPYAIGLASIGAVVMIALAGNTYVTSGGSPETVSQAKEMIVGALLGLATIILASLFIKWMVNTNPDNAPVAPQANQSQSEQPPAGNPSSPN